MEFSYTDVQNNLRELTHWLAENKIRPLSLQADRDHRWPEDFLLELHQMGVSGGGAIEQMAAAERKGDKKKASQANRSAAIAVEEMAWGDASLILSLPGPGLGGPPVEFAGTPEQKERFLGIFRQPDMLHWGAYGLTEPAAGSDVAAIRTSARKDGSHWVLNGRKCFITNGARADWVVIFATTDPSLGRAGHLAFVVEKGTAGFSVGKIEEKMGLRASETAELLLDEVRVHEDNLLGGESSGGFKTAMKTFDNTRPMVASMAVGIGRAAFERARDFAKDAFMLSRPIPRYASIRQMLGVIERRLEAARTLVWRAASMADEGIPNTKEASMSKAFAAEVAQQATIDALEIMGAAGNHRDALVEKWFRDVKVYDIFEGTGQIQRVVIAKRLFESIKTF